MGLNVAGQARSSGRTVRAVGMATPGPTSPIQLPPRLVLTLRSSTRPRRQPHGVFLATALRWSWPAAAAQGGIVQPAERSGAEVGFVCSGLDVGVVHSVVARSGGPGLTWELPIPRLGGAEDFATRALGPPAQVVGVETRGWAEGRPIRLRNHRPLARPIAWIG